MGSCLERAEFNARINAKDSNIYAGQIRYG